MPMILFYRLQLFAWSIVYTPTCYLECLAKLARKGRTDWSFVMLGPWILPLTAFTNGYANNVVFDDKLENDEAFWIDWPTFELAYKGAAFSTGDKADLTSKIRMSLKIAQ